MQYEGRNADLANNKIREKQQQQAVAKTKSISIMNGYKEKLVTFLKVKLKW